MKRVEEIEQARFVKWSHRPDVRAVIPAVAWLFHVPNGGKRDAFTGAQMRALGVKPGVPDLLLPVASYGYVGLAIEMKSDTGSVKPAQNGWLDHLRGESWRIAVCRSAEEARKVIEDYFMAEVPAL